MIQTLRQTWIDAPPTNRRLVWFALALLIVGAVAANYGKSMFLKSYGIYFERHTVGCLPWVFYFADRKVDTVNRNDIVLFDSKGAGPLFADGSRLAKLAVGVPGDHVVSAGDKIYINGQYWGSMKLGRQKFGKPAGFWDRDVVLKSDEYFMLGTEPRSFDSRFWGVVKRDQVRAKLHLIF